MNESINQNDYMQTQQTDRKKNFDHLTQFNDFEPIFQWNLSQDRKIVGFFYKIIFQFSKIECKKGEGKN